MNKDRYIRVGTSSFSSEDWVGPFYPDGTKPDQFLKFYSEHFSTVEIDSTYYSIPSAKIVDGWAAKTPESFLISVKFPRSIVHGGEGSRPDPALVLQPDKTYAERDRFLKVIQRLGPRLGPLVLQFPFFAKTAFGSADEFYSLLQRFLNDLPGDFRYAVEIRNRNWLTPEFADLLRGFKVGLVLVDQAWMPHGDEVERQFDPVTSECSYIRLLGDRNQIEAITKTWEKEVIDRTERLKRWGSFLYRLSVREIQTLVYVNNHYAGHAPATARRLEEFYLAEQGHDGRADG